MRRLWVFATFAELIRSSTLAVLMIASALLFVVSPALAKPASEPQAVVDLIEKYPELPKTQRQAIDQLYSDFQTLSRAEIESLAMGSRYREIETFVEALKQGEDIVTLEHLAREIRMNENVSIKFLTALSLKIQNDPELLARIENNLDLLSDHLKTQKVESLPWRMRTTEHLLTASGILGTMYGILGTYGESGASHLISSGGKLQVMLGCYLMIGVFRDAIATIKGWKTYWRERRRNASAKEVTDFLKQAVGELQKSPKAQEYVSKLSRAQASLLGNENNKVIAGALERYAQSIEEMDEREKSSAEVYARKKRFIDLVKEFRAALSHSEIEKLNELLAKPRSGVMPLSFSTKMAWFEKKVAYDIRDWMNSSGAKDEVQLRLAHARHHRNLDEGLLRGLRGGYGPVLSNIGMSTAITLYGFQLSFGLEETPLDRYFFPELIEWVRHNDMLLRGVAAIAIISPIVYSAWETSLVYNERKADPLPAKQDFERFDAIKKAMNQTRPALKSKAKNKSLMEQTATDFVEYLHVRRDIGPMTCKEIFR